MRRQHAAPVLLLLAACATVRPAPVAPAAAVRSLPTARGKLAVDDGGTGGLPVLFVHGEGGTKELWAEQLAHLRKTRRAVAVDLAGFGQSEPPRDGDWSPLALGEDLGRVADSLGVSRFVLVLHGFSGTLGSSYAARHPLRVAGIFFLEAEGGRGDTPAVAFDAVRKKYTPDLYKQSALQRNAPLLSGAFPITRGKVLATIDQTSREAHLAAALAPFSSDTARDLKTYRGPRFALTTAANVLLGVQGNFDEVPYRKEEVGSHWLMLDQPAVVNAALDEFLAKVK